MKLSRLMGGTSACALALAMGVSAASAELILVLDAQKDVVVDINHMVTHNVTGDITVDLTNTVGFAAASSSVEVHQDVKDNVLSDQLDTGESMDNTATNGDIAGGEGNIGVNTAAGRNNAQANQTAISMIASGSGAASVEATVESNQKAARNDIVPGTAISTSNTATGGLVDGVGGNIGVNTAAGFWNLQQNSLAVAEGSEGLFATAWVDAVQDLDAPNGINIFGVALNTATGGTISNAVGNIGANYAAGFVNLQANSVAVAHASDAALATAVAESRQDIENQDYGIAGVQNNTATSGAMTVVSGNVGVNVAAGYGNAQVNSLALAATTTSP